MKTYAFPEDMLSVDIEQVIAWASRNGLDAHEIVQSTFRVTEHEDGSLVASGHLFVRDAKGWKIVETDECFAKAPFTAGVSSIMPQMNEVPA